jgi:hypothetical protein
VVFRNFGPGECGISAENGCHIRRMIEVDRIVNISK